MEKCIRSVLSRSLASNVRYEIYHHSSKSHYGLQLTDYCSWEVFRKWEMRNLRLYNRIRPSVRYETLVLQSPMAMRDALLLLPAER